MEQAMDDLHRIESQDPWEERRVENAGSIRAVHARDGGQSPRKRERRRAPRKPVNAWILSGHLERPAGDADIGMSESLHPKSAPDSSPSSGLNLLA